MSRDEIVLLAVVCAFLVPIWAFPYVPTQDGPAHLANALILKDCGSSGNRFSEFYWINWRPIPNWTCFALLAVFTYVAPPIVAEKLLVSLYLGGFAFAFRYFTKSMGNNLMCLAAAGFLLAFNRCFWLGFYNYCLSLSFYFVIVGFVLRYSHDFGARHAVALSMLFLAAFFTHVFGFVLSAMSALWIAATIPPRRWKKLFLGTASVLPCCVLTLRFFEEAQFFGGSGFGRLSEHLSGWIDAERQWRRITGDVGRLNMEMFGMIGTKSTIMLGGIAVVYCGVLLAGFYRGEPRLPEQKDAVRSVIVLGILLALLYFLLPNMLTVGKGGFWKSRLVCLPPLLWLGCAGTPSIRWVRYVLTTCVFLLVSFELGVVTSYIRNENRELAEFTAAVDMIGRDRVILFQADTSDNRPVRPLLHAVDYYCLESRNIKLGGDFNTVLHSIVRLRSEIREGGGSLEGHPNRAMVDVIVSWDVVDDHVPEGFKKVFEKGRLKIMERTKDVRKDS